MPCVPGYSFMEQEQLTLNLQIRPAPSLDNFAVGDNAELVSVLRTMAETGSGPQFLYLWGRDRGRLHALAPCHGSSGRRRAGSRFFREPPDLYRG